jgi:hypothetical protein
VLEATKLDSRQFKTLFKPEETEINL